MASGSTETEHFMWLKEHSSSQALAAARDCSEPVLTASLSRVLTPGSTASGNSLVSCHLLGSSCKNVHSGLSNISSTTKTVVDLLDDELVAAL